MEAKSRGLLHTNMTYRRRSREEIVNKHTLGCHLLTKERREEGKNLWLTIL